LIQTKSASVERLLSLHHQGHTTLSWSLNPPRIASSYESGAPSVDERITAMRRCAKSGYPIKAVIQPFIPEGEWESDYAAFVATLLERVPSAEVTVAGMCIGRRARMLLENKHGCANAVSRNLERPNADNGRAYYNPSLEQGLFKAVEKTIHNRFSGVNISMGKQCPSNLNAMLIGLSPIQSARNAATGTQPGQTIEAAIQ
jgi:DNA repair photolyase